MPRVYVFADESGNFDFSRSLGATTYYILTTVTLRDCTVGTSLSELRRELAWEGIGLDGHFHATGDSWPVRNRIFAMLDEHHFRIDATILEKSKAQPHIRATNARFYQYAWWLHMKFLAKQLVKAHDELLVVSASIGESKQLRESFYGAVESVVRQVSPTLNFQVAFWGAATEHCLQVADYCAWAIQRKWERADTAPYDRVKGKIATEFAPFQVGKTHYY